MRRCFALLYTRVSFRPLSLSSFLPTPVSRSTGVRECPECLRSERSARALYPFGTLLSPGLSTETRFGPLAREKLALWPVLIRLFLEEGFLEIVGLMEKSFIVSF